MERGSLQALPTSGAQTPRVNVPFPQPTLLLTWVLVSPQAAGKFLAIL